MQKPENPSTARIVQLMSQLAPLEGYNLSPLDDVRFLRSNRPLTRTPVLYEPGIVIIWVMKFTSMTPSIIWWCRCQCLLQWRPMLARRSQCWRFTCVWISPWPAS
mgnify:CR=1 FL=1